MEGLPSRRRRAEAELPAAPTALGEQVAARLPTLVLIVLVVAALHFAQPILLPFAVAVLLSFVLAPVAGRLERLHLGRVAAVAVTVLLGLGIALAAAFVMGRQAADLVRQLPKYEKTLRDRVRTLRGMGNGALSEAAETVENLEQELAETEAAKERKSAERSAIRGLVFGDAPMPVRVVDPSPLPIRIARQWLAWLMLPVGTAVLVVLFVTFMLIYREDLRDRLFRLAGRDHVCATTEAVEDAGRRVSRYLLMQVSINTIHGTAVGLGLGALGLPNAFLWGLLAGLLRFVPYLGPWLGAAAPVLLSLAVFEGWVIPLWTAGLFVALELIVNNVLEPLLYGSSTGVTPMAVIISAVFWTWLWGPVGLILATPLLVCLTAVAKHVPQLAFFNAALASGPPLEPHLRFYQRLLAFDRREARRVLHEQLDDKPFDKVCESIIFPALILAEGDRRTGRLSEDRNRFLAESVVQIAAEILPRPSDAAARPVAATARRQPLKVLCLGTGSDASRVAASLFGQQLAARGHAVASSRPGLDEEGILEQFEQTPVDCVALVSLGSGAGAVAAHRLTRSIRRGFPELPILLALWQGCRSEKLPGLMREAGADAVAVTLAVAIEEAGRLAGERRSDKSLAAEPGAVSLAENLPLRAAVSCE